MPDDEQRARLEPPKLFGRRRPPAAPDPAAPRAKAAPKPAPKPAPEPTPTAEPEAVDDEPTEVFTDTGRDPVPEPATEPNTEPTAVLPVAAPPVRHAPRPARTQPAKAAEATEPATTPRERTPLTERLTGRLAVVAAGGVVGLALVALMLLGLLGCRAVSGTSSCGTGPGLGALLVVFVLTVVVGRFVLTALEIPEPGSTSFLGVGLTSVVALALLIDVLDTWPMVIVIPVLTALAFLASAWLTTAFTDPEGRPRD